MSILKDYIAYARSYVNPKLSEEAAQYLIQAYVGKKTLVIDCLLITACMKDEACLSSHFHTSKQVKQHTVIFNQFLLSFSCCLFHHPSIY